MIIDNDFGQCEGLDIDMMVFSNSDLGFLEVGFELHNLDYCISSVQVKVVISMAARTEFRDYDGKDEFDSGRYDGFLDFRSSGCETKRC